MRIFNKELNEYEKKPEPRRIDISNIKIPTDEDFVKSVRIMSHSKIMKDYLTDKDGMKLSLTYLEFIDVIKQINELTGVEEKTGDRYRMPYHDELSQMYFVSEWKKKKDAPDWVYQTETPDPLKISREWLSEILEDGRIIREPEEITVVGDKYIFYGGDKVARVPKKAGFFGGGGIMAHQYCSHVTDEPDDEPVYWNPGQYSQPIMCYYDGGIDTICLSTYNDINSVGHVRLAKTTDYEDLFLAEKT